MLQLHRLRLGEMLVALGHIEAVEPSLLRRVGVVKEKNIRGDTRIGRKDAARQADDGVQVKLRKQLLLDACLRVVRAEQEPVGQHHGGALNVVLFIMNKMRRPVRRRRFTSRYPCCYSIMYS